MKFEISKSVVSVSLTRRLPTMYSMIVNMMKLTTNAAKTIVDRRIAWR